MTHQILCFDPTASDKQSQFRGVGRYLQILKENFPQWIFSNTLHVTRYTLHAFINPFFNFLQSPIRTGLDLSLQNLSLQKILSGHRIAKKQIAVIHDLIPLKYPSKFPAGIRGNFNIFLNKLALKNYDLIVTDSEASKKDIVQILKLPEEKVKVIYPCLPKIFKKELKSQNSKVKTKTQNLKTEKNNKDKKKFLDLSCSFEICDLSFELSNFCLYVGDATWNKNLVNLAKAIKIANVTCIFVGKVFQIKSETNSKSKIINQKRFENLNLENWNLFRTSNLEFRSFNPNHPWQKELKEFFQLTKDDKRFIFLGYINDYRLIKLYQQAIVNILPSRDEGFGFSYLEAASQGCPSVIANIPVLEEISNNQGVLKADQNDPYDLANKIGEIYFNQDLKEKLSFEAQQRSKFFKADSFKNQLQKIL